GPPPDCLCPAYPCHAQCEDFTAPYWSYDHSVGQSITGGPVYRGTAYPQYYLGNVFVGDFVQGWIKRVSGNPPIAVDFPNGLPAIVDLEVGTDGNVYGVQYYGSLAGVYRFVYCAACD